MFALILAALLQAPVEARITVVPLHEFVIVEPSGGYARDGRFEYLAHEGGLYRAPNLASGPLERMPAAGTGIHTIAVHEGALYVLRGVPWQSTSSEHTLLRSMDGGETFEAIDDGLYDCSLLPYGYPCAWLVPHQIAFAPGRIFIEASGNLLVSADSGASWITLLGGPGQPEPRTCPLVFERVGERMLLGSECPLDLAWIQAGVLRSDMLGWSRAPFTPEAPVVVTPEMENRNVHFIRDFGNDIVFAGAEAAVLKSVDGGSTFAFVLHHPIEDPASYPYVYDFLAPSSRPELLLVSGFDKADGTAWLGWSVDGGESWSEERELGGAEWVSLLVEDASGRILVGLHEGGVFTLAELQIEFEQPVGRRRVVRR